MAFVSWKETLISWKDALARGADVSLWINSTENSRMMRTTYQNLGSIQRFTEFLEAKAAEEATGFEPGMVYTSVGGSW